MTKREALDEWLAKVDELLETLEPPESSGDAEVDAVEVLEPEDGLE